MPSVLALLKNVDLPPLRRMRAPLVPDGSLADVRGAVLESLRTSTIGTRIRPGMHIAVGVGSRGVANLSIIVRAVVDWLRERGAAPFIVPAMGSHGGGDAEKQCALLAEYGVTEESMGCPVLSDMEAVHLASLPDDLEVCLDPHAAKADGILVINRIKPHNAFRARNESGIVKMLVAGLGKQQGAASCHKKGFERMPERLAAAAAYLIQHSKVLGGIAVVEDMRQRTCHVEAVPAECMLERDAALLELAWKNLARLPVDALDALIIDEMGKNISGSGMDPNVLGRYTVPFLRGGPSVNKIAVLDLTGGSEGNAIGMGLADFITRRLLDKIDFEAVYANALTSTVLSGSRMPCVLPTDRDVARAAVKTCNGGGPDAVRLMRIRSTLHLDAVEISPALAPELREAGWEPCGGPAPPAFDEAGNFACRL
jgi:hypothetical protein